MGIETKHAEYSILNYVNDSKVGFDKKPFNEIDGLVLSQISNMKFENLGIDIYSGEGKTLKQIYDSMHLAGTPANDTYNSMGPNERNLFDALATSDRYKDMVVSNYVNNPVTGYDKPIDGFGEVNGEDAFMEQFAAVTVTYKQNGETYNYMSFQATNDTTDGWAEDFAMLCRTDTQAQKDSVDYMNIVGRKLEGHIVGGGHSKGGNDFEYGYLFCDEEIRQRIEKGYIYDSPGVSEDVLALTDRYDDFQAIVKGTYICPQDSIIGQLLHENENAEFIHSVESGFLEHDPYTWEIVPGSDSFVPDSQTELSKIFNEATDKAVKGMTIEQRNALFDFIQYLMYNNGGESLKGIGDLFTDGWDDPGAKILELWMVFSGALDSMPEEEREEFWNSLGVIVSTLIAEGYDYLTKDLDPWLKEQIDRFANKLEFVWTVVSTAVGIVNWAKKAFENLYNSFVENIKKIAVLLQRFSAGYKQATDNPFVELDTYKLTAYSQRLMKVNRRIANLDRRLDSLYWHVGLAGLWDLIQADFLTGYSGRLLLAATYLNDTASDFNRIEKELTNSL